MPPRLRPLVARRRNVPRGERRTATEVHESIVDLFETHISTTSSWRGAPQDFSGTSRGFPLGVEFPSALVAFWGALASTLFDLPQRPEPIAEGPAPIPTVFDRDPHESTHERD